MSRHQSLCAVGLLIVLGGLGIKTAMVPGAPGGGQNPSPPAVGNSPAIIKSETNLVLMDVVATDKKGNYIEDLKQKDFHIYEDGVEQTISAFSREADSESSATHERYMVLFFDDSSSDPGLKMAARDAARKFVESAASPERLMAVVDFSRGLKIAQNFTANTELLKRAVSTVKSDSVQPNNGNLDSGLKAMGGPFQYHTAPDLNASTLLLSIRDVAQWLRAFPGRKTLILFSAGFVLSSERQPELPAGLDALNKANVAVYPVEVHGLTSSATFEPDCKQTSRMGGNPCLNQGFQSMVPANGGATNQQVFDALAKGTGGFEIFNNSDFFQGLEKIAREMNEYYNLGYAPPNQTHDGSYHRINLKVDRPGVIVRNRAGYYDVKSPDPLKGKPEGQALEARAASPQAGEIPVALSAPYFYVKPGVARVNLALTIPGSSVEFAKQNGAFHSDVNVMGIDYSESNSVAARFSDTVKLDYQKKDLKVFTQGSFNYQNTFRIAPGSYTLKVVLNAGGEKFGKYVAPLVVEPFTGNNLSLGGPALGDQFLPVSQQTANTDAALMEDRAPLVFKGMELAPSTSCRFAKNAQPVVYVEVYDPLLKDSMPPFVGVMFNIIDRKTSQQVFSSNTILINDYSQPGNPLVPVGIKLPVDRLQAGDYRFEIKGRDAMGNASTVHSADFSIE
jgi:VWFA-related protein